MARKALALIAASAALALAAVSAVVAVPAFRAAPPPPLIATVDLERIITALHERNLRQNELTVFADGLQSELTKIGNEITNLGEKMKAADAAEKKAIAPQVLEKQFNAKVKKELYEALIDQRRGEVFKGLYEKITDACKRLAQRNGYTMVLSSDVGVRVPDGPSNEIERTITLKRFLYVAPEHDVTKELVDMMNNEWAAGGGIVPAPALAPAPPVMPPPSGGGAKK